MRQWASGRQEADPSGFNCENSQSTDDKTNIDIDANIEGTGHVVGLRRPRLLTVVSDLVAPCLARIRETPRTRTESTFTIARHIIALLPREPGFGPFACPFEGWERRPRQSGTGEKAHRQDGTRQHGSRITLGKWFLHRSSWTLRACVEGTLGSRANEASVGCFKT